LKFRVALFACLLLPGGLASAETLTGTVTNETTGKPAAGDDVVLMALSQGMSEVGRTRTDAQGKFSLNIDDANVPHLVRVNHQGVNYFPSGGPVRPGVNSVEIKVYDAAKKLDGITTNVNVMRMQADGGQLQVLELISVKNNSKPPRSLMSDRTYEFYLPEGAQIDQSLASGPGGMPVNSAAVPAEKGRYFFVFPLRPGETRFEIAYHLPYSGEATITPKITSDMQHFVVVLPKSMNFEAKDSAAYSPMNDPGGGQSNVEVASGVVPGKDLAFRVSGTGVLQEEGEAGAPAGAANQQAQAMGRDNRPGGGLGPPVDAPDPLHQYRWAILGGVVAVLVAGGVYIATRPGTGRARAATADLIEPAPVPTAAGRSTQSSKLSTGMPVTLTSKATAAESTAIAPPSSHPAMLLAALKEELFQLEVDRQQGRVNQQEYEEAKSALDQTLKRALARTQRG